LAGRVNWIALSSLSNLVAGVNHITLFGALEYQRTQGNNATQLAADITNAQPDILEKPRHFIVAKGIHGSTFDINNPLTAKNIRFLSRKIHIIYSVRILPTL